MLIFQLDGPIELSSVEGLMEDRKCDNQTTPALIEILGKRVGEVTDVGKKIRTRNLHPADISSPLVIRRDKRRHLWNKDYRMR